HNNIPLIKALLRPSPEEKRKHPVQSPSSYFMDVKCPGCYKVTTTFSHAPVVVLCWLLHCPRQPTGGKARLTEGCSFKGRSTEST
ncbi:40S ribosomal protein S27-like, partial [Sturnira hondurensis]|uniref:40S ribosomal protein S27-like n=1 Tax=Sturnira hondurensis TaxID=192404 RepID=UPI00187AF2BF